jgi:hypothetical protein
MFKNNKHNSTADFSNTKTYKNQEFLSSPEARQIRILCELTAPKQRFEEQGVENTIVFFGSARSVPMEKSRQNLALLEKRLKEPKADLETLQQELEHAKMQVKLSRYYEASASLAKKLTAWSLGFPENKNRFYICSGGGPGMMEASNKGAAEANGPSIGMNISLPFEQDPNPYQTSQLSFVFHYFFIRKFWFAYLAKALVVFPGGFGTMDELFEMLTLIQTRKVHKVVPIILFGSEFWNSFIDFNVLVKWGVIKKEDLNLFRLFDDVDEAFVYLKEVLTKEYLGE